MGTTEETYQDKLIVKLMERNFKKDEILVACAMLDSETLSEQMLNWMEKNPKADQSDILRKVADLAPDED